MGFNAMFSPLLLLALVACSVTAQEDRLIINGIASGDQVIVMLDARENANVSGCRNDLIFPSAGHTLLGNLRETAGCNSEIVIFSKNHAMFLETNVNKWTDKPGDTHTVTLQPLIDVPVSVWVLDDEAARRADVHMRKAINLYRENRVGVHFVPKIRKLSEVAADPDAVKIVNDGIVQDGDDWACQNLRAIQDRTFYTARTLNVYYVNKPLGGRNCAILKTPPDCATATTFPRGDGNITFIGRGASLTALAHEFGHAFGLRPGICGGHTNLLPQNFGPDNIMWTPDELERVRFTLGQVFRMNTHWDEWGGTMLIENGLRPVPARLCPPQLAGTTCPALHADWP